jgi:hypothetical protein
MSDMTLSIIIFIVSVAVLMFYLQVHCEKILLRRLNQQFFHSVVEAYPLAFPFVGKALEDFGVPVDYKRLRMELKCEFLALTYLLKDTGNAKGFSAKEQLKGELFVRELSWYFYAVFLVLWIKQRIGLSERAAVLKLTSILEYFANVLGERVGTTRTIRFA